METPLSTAIRSIRTRLQLSQCAFGQVLFVRENTIWRWEKGRATPGSWALITLYSRAETEEETNPIVRALERRGLPVNTGLGAGTHETIAPNAERPS